MTNRSSVDTDAEPLLSIEMPSRYNRRGYIYAMACMLTPKKHVRKSLSNDTSLSSYSSICNTCFSGTVMLFISLVFSIGTSVIQRHSLLCQNHRAKRAISSIHRQKHTLHPQSIGLYSVVRYRVNILFPLFDWTSSVTMGCRRFPEQRAYMEGKAFY